MRPPIVLASTSPYRRQLLDRLGFAYQTASPQVEETQQAGETAQQMAGRLAEAKARAVAVSYPQALIIGADQVAVLRDETNGQEEIVHKPGTHTVAVAQLQRFSGRTLHFYAGICLYHSGEGNARTLVVPSQVLFRPLDADLIDSYLRREQPYDCVGCFKSEGLGIILFEQITGEDPTALIGLPLIALRRLLQQENFAIL
ncbi:MAG: septum formation protein Maf [Magnetococcales bacterium]|nr:septum formation protein Maf [Magnetococcales bacterium]